MTPWQRHQAKWLQCQRCELCHGRKHVVLCRGELPCAVLFAGEGPGESEDVMGRPFCGPAGQLLDAIVKESLAAAGAPDLSCAFTNLVACIPRDEVDRKADEPPPEAVDACAPRLAELVAMAKPQLIVCVGGLAKDELMSARGKRGTLRDWSGELVDVVHPAAILRANPAQRGLMVRRCVARLANAVQTVIEQRRGGG